MKHGNFDTLATNYTKYRPAYSPLVLDTFLGLLKEGARGLDVGGGTGLWTKMLSEKVANLEAVEPSDNMRAEGMAFVPNVKWHGGSAE